MFLLLTSIAMVMVYAFLGNYGVAQDQTLRSAYQLAYIDSVGKAIYQIHAQTLAEVSRTDANDVNFVDSDYCLARTRPTRTCAGDEGKPYLDLAVNADPRFTCAQLTRFPGQSIADLLKKDLGDAPANEDENSVCFDNRFGKRPGDCTQPDQSPRTTSIALVPGKTALRCGLKELMKPFQAAGFRYFSDVLKEQTTNTVPQELPDNPGWQRVTNSWVADAELWSSCEQIRDEYTETVLGPASPGRLDILTASLPFRIPRSDTVKQFFSFRLRVCVWKTQAV